MARAKRDEVVCMESPDESILTSIPPDGDGSTLSIARKTRKFAGERLYATHQLESPNGQFDFYELEKMPANDPKWDEWRRQIDEGNAMVIGGSSFAALLGLSSHTSADKAMQQVTRTITKESLTANWYATQAMAHGKAHEDYVRKVLERVLSGTGYVPDSTVYRMEYYPACFSVLLCASPDWCYGDDSNSGRDSHGISEIKCPYYHTPGITDVIAFVKDFNARTLKKNGTHHRLDYIAQALFYSWIDSFSGRSRFFKRRSIEIAIGFCIGNEMVVQIDVYRYSTAWTMLVSRAMRHIMDYLVTGDYSRKYLPPKNIKKEMIELCSANPERYTTCRYNLFIDGSISPMLGGDPEDLSDLEEQSEN
jgi:hypothetical protein